MICEDCAQCRGRVTGILGEMRGVVAGLSGEAEVLTVLMDDLEAGLPAETEDEKSPDQS